METIEEFPVVNSKAEGLANILELMDKGDAMLHGLKDKLDYAKKMFDEAKEHFDKEEWGMCIGALIASAAIVESMETGENPAEVFTRLTDEFRADQEKEDE
jgi:hypothetical protein